MPPETPIPAEMLPKSIDYAGIHFNLASTGDGKPDAVVSRGQKISLPAGKFTRVYILAASMDGDQNATFKIGDKAVDLTVQAWNGYIGQWDNRIWKATTTQVPPGANAAPGTPPTTRTNIYGEMVGMTPGFVKPAPVACGMHLITTMPMAETNRMPTLTCSRTRSTFQQTRPC